MFGRSVVFGCCDNFINTMARAVSQETFDGVVRENVEDLDMTVEEAAQDAIQQFKAQVSSYLAGPTIVINIGN